MSIQQGPGHGSIGQTIRTDDAAPVSRLSLVTRTRKLHFSMATREAIAFWLCVLPWCIGFLWFYAGPMVASIVLSFTDYTITGAPSFVGLENYRVMLFEDPLFWQSLKVTFIFTFTAVPLGLLISLLVAVMLNQKIPAVGAWRTFYYLPRVVSGVAVALLWALVFDKTFGLLNALLWEVFGIEGPGWLSSPRWVLVAFVIMSIWGIGGSVVLFLAALQGVPTELYEAAQIDGAGAQRRFRTITLPMISPTMLFNLVTVFIATFQTFTTALIMTRGGPENASLFYGLYLYRHAFSYFKMGYASALAWVLFVIVISLSLVLLRSSNSWVYYETGNGEL